MGWDNLYRVSDIGLGVPFVVLDNDPRVYVRIESAVASHGWHYNALDPLSSRVVSLSEDEHVLRVASLKHLDPEYGLPPEWCAYHLKRLSTPQVLIVSGLWDYTKGEELRWYGRQGSPEQTAEVSRPSLMYMGGQYEDALKLCGIGIMEQIKIVTPGEAGLFALTGPGRYLGKYNASKR